MSFMNVPILVLILWLFLLFLEKSEGVRGVSRHHSGLEEAGRYFRANSQQSTVNTIANFSAYKEKLIRPCGYRGSGSGYRPTIGKRGGSRRSKRSLWNRIMEVSSKKDHSQNILFKALSFLRENLLSESLEDNPTERRRRDVVEQNIITLELRNRINDVQFIIIQHLLLELNYNCEGQKPSTLSAIPEFTNSTFQQASRSLLRSIAEVRAHIFFMRLDWHMSPYLPCVSVTRVHGIINNYQELDERLSHLTCQILQSIFDWQPLATVVDDLSSITTTQIRRYSSCEARNTRDCAVVFYLKEMLSKFDIFVANYY